MGDRRCCCGCLNYIDNFNRTDASTAGTDWVEISEDWEIKSEQLYEDGTVAVDGAILIYAKPMPRTWMSVGITIKTLIEGGTYRLYLSWKNINNHLAAQLEIGPFVDGALNEITVSISKVIDGVKTGLDSHTWEVPGLTEIQFNACIDEKLFISSISGDELFCHIFSDSVYIEGGHRGGVGHGNEEEVYFDDWSISEGYAADKKCFPCSACHCINHGSTIEHTLPKSLLLTFVADPEGLCNTLNEISCTLALERCGSGWIYRGVLEDSCLAGLDFELECNETLQNWILRIGQQWEQDYTACFGVLAYVHSPVESDSCDPFSITLRIGPYDNVSQQCPDLCLPCGEDGPADGPWTQTEFQVIITEHPDE